MYEKPCVIVVPILHILIPNKKWMGKHLLWSLDIIQELSYLENFRVHQPLHPFCTLKSCTFDPKPLENPIRSWLIRMACNFLLEGLQKIQSVWLLPIREVDLMRAPVSEGEKLKRDHIARLQRHCYKQEPTYILRKRAGPSVKMKIHVTVWPQSSNSCTWLKFD